MRHAFLPSLLLALAAVPAAGRAADQKIGYVDLQRALNEVEEGKTAKALLQKDFAEKQKTLDWSEIKEFKGQRAQRGSVLMRGWRDIDRLEGIAG